MKCRPPIATEMRYDAWDALSWGAKGIFFNEMGTDGGANIGICDGSMLADYDYWIRSAHNKGIYDWDTHIGNCSEPFLNYTDHLIIFDNTISGCTLPSNLNKYQWVPITVTESNLNSWLSSNNIAILYNQDGTSHSVYGTNSLIPSPGCWKPYKYDFCYQSNQWAAFFNTYPTSIVHSDNGSPDIIVAPSNHENYLPLKDGSIWFRTWVPTFYGFKERWNGAREIVTDISHCANTLATLNWIGTYNYPDVIHSASNIDVDGFKLSTNFTHDSPINFVQSFKMQMSVWPLAIRTALDLADPEPFAELPLDEPVTQDGIADSWSDPTNDRRLYEFGFFQYKNIPVTQTAYAIVANKRTWTYYVVSNQIKMTDNGDALLGAIDARELRFTVDASQSRWSTYKNLDILKKFLVTDYRDPCHPQLKKSWEQFSI